MNNFKTLHEDVPQKMCKILKRINMQLCDTVHQDMKIRIFSINVLCAFINHISHLNQLYA
jgi:hypothetical protein